MTVSEGKEPLGQHPADLLREAARRIRESVQPIEQGTERANAYSRIDNREGYFVGLVGLRARDLSREAEEPLAIRSLAGQDLAQYIDISLVDNPPGVVHLATALESRLKGQFALVGHAARSVRHELYISHAIASNPQGALNAAHRVLYSLRIKTGNLFTAVGFSDVSWNQMAAASGSLDVQLLDPPGKPRWDERGASVGRSDLEWGFFNGPRIFSLYENPAFRLAFDSAGESPFLSDVRTSIARTWSGIEALFDVQQELSYRLSMYSAVLVSDSLEARIEFQRQFKSLYAKRSKAVHGTQMSESELSSTVYESWRLLSMLIVACVNTGDKLVSPALLDRALLGEKLARMGSFDSTASPDSGASKEHKETLWAAPTVSARG